MSSVAVIVVWRLALYYRYRFQSVPVRLADGSQVDWRWADSRRRLKKKTYIYYFD